MEKKNPYIMTIGFKKEDEDHVEVADFLNSLGRGKAQYIVKAVKAYQELQRKADEPPATGIIIDYAQIRSIVNQVLEEREFQASILNPKVKDAPEKSQTEENDVLSQLDASAVSGILASIAAFQEQ